MQSTFMCCMCTLEDNGGSRLANWSKDVSSDKNSNPSSSKECDHTTFMTKQEQIADLRKDLTCQINAMKLG